MKTIDCTPTWEEILPMLIRLLNSDKTEARQCAHDELLKMAKIADHYNKLVKKGAI